MPVADKTFLNDPELVLIRPLPTTNAIGGRENFNLWAGNKIGHKAGLIIGLSPKSDGPRRSVTAEDFSLYVHRPTATDPSFAPEGCDSFYVLCPVPNLAGGQDWSVEGPKLRDRIVGALDATMLPGLSDHITAEFAMTPEDFKSDYLSVDGAGFSLSPFFSQSAWFRFHNRAEGVDGLYFVGAGTHPGAGLPGVVSSAKVLDTLVPAAVTLE